MKPRKIEITEKGKTTIHYDMPYNSGVDITLCLVAPDSMSDLNAIDSIILLSNKKVTCKDCLEIVKIIKRDF